MDFVKMGLETAKKYPAKAGQLTKTVRIDMDEKDAIIKRMAKQFPSLEYNENAVIGAMEVATGGRAVITAAKQATPSGGFTLYHNGKLVLTGVCANFNPAKPEPKPRKAVEAPAE